MAAPLTQPLNKNNETTTNHELKRLKKELAQAKEENEILKKAVAIFTQK